MNAAAAAPAVFRNDLRLVMPLLLGSCVVSAAHTIYPNRRGGATVRPTPASSTATDSNPAAGSPDSPIGGRRAATEAPVGPSRSNPNYDSGFAVVK